MEWAFKIAFWYNRNHGVKLELNERHYTLYHDVIAHKRQVESRFCFVVGNSSSVLFLCVYNCIFEGYLLKNNLFDMMWAF